MKPPVETVRISVTGRERLIQLKRATGIEHWNELCRWALCHALSSKQRHVQTGPMERSNIEMSWPTFAGAYGPMLALAVTMKWEKAKHQNPDLSIADFFNSSMEYGIAILPKAVQQTTEKNLCGLVCRAAVDTEGLD